ncbi:MAG: MotA/TolQ/ExbB proton channel family protein [Planctomycetales bacterium]|nr:MotA/TolQ/ExbB proton channel family protein [Planctomycetales bacterium]
MDKITEIVGLVIYASLAAIALWGLYHVVMIWSRVGQKRFRTEEEQDEFLEALEQPLASGHFAEAEELLDGDRRAVCQLGLLAISNRDMGYAKVQKLVGERFQRDVLNDLEYRLSWVNTVIKSAPMVGLLGTVIGMMGAFGKLATAENVKADQLANDIMVALITTASGLSIAIPLVLCVTMVNARIQAMEDLSGTGLMRILDALKPHLEKRKGLPRAAS